MKVSVNPKVGDEYVAAQAYASCMCANSIILDLVSRAASDRKPKLSGTRPAILVIDGQTKITSPMTTAEYTELREALMNAVYRGVISYNQPPPGVLGAPLAQWGGMTITQWFSIYNSTHQPGDTITQFVERQTKEQHP